MRRLEDISIILNQRREQNAPANRKIRFLQRICSRCFMEILLESPVIWGAGIRVPGSAGETTAALYEQYGVSPLIMADGPAGLRLQQNYEVDRETDTVYGIGVLGSLENGYLRTNELGKRRQILSVLYDVSSWNCTGSRTWILPLSKKLE